MKKIRKFTWYNFYRLFKEVKMNCSEKELQTLIEKAVNQAVKPLEEQNRKLMEEISELKHQQTQTFKQILEDTIQNQLAKMVEEKFNQLLKKADKLYEGEGELAGNQREIVKAIAMVRDEIVKHLKESKESEDKLLAQGEKVLEVLDDLGKGLVTMNKNVLDSNSQWGVAMLERFDDLAHGMLGLSKAIDNAKEYLRRNNDLTYDAVKKLDETISRKW